MIVATAWLVNPALKAPIDTFTAPHKTLPPALHCIDYFGTSNNQIEIMMLLSCLVTVNQLRMAFPSTLPTPICCYMSLFLRYICILELNRKVNVIAIICVRLGFQVFHVPLLLSATKWMAGSPTCLTPWRTGHINVWVQRYISIWALQHISRQPLVTKHLLHCTFFLNLSYLFTSYIADSNLFFSTKGNVYWAANNRGEYINFFPYLFVVWSQTTLKE